MSKICQLTGKKPVMGNKYTYRGIPKKKKGIGLKVTGIKRRRFLPNLKKKRFWLPEENRFVTIRLSTSAIKTVDKVGITEVVSRLRAANEKF